MNTRIGPLRPHYLLTALMVLAIAAPIANALVTINFDVDASGVPIVAPSLFASAVNLTTEYASLGVIFSGGGPLDGGSILDEAGSFGIDARSGNNFLAFNEDAENSLGGIATDPETLTFSSLIDTAEIYASGGEAARFSMEAYRNNILVDSDLKSNLAGAYVQLSVSSATGIDRIVLTELTGDFAYVYDDLSYRLVPEPASALLLLGASGILTLRRYRPWQN